MRALHLALNGAWLANIVRQHEMLRYKSTGKGEVPLTDAAGQAGIH